MFCKIKKAKGGIMLGAGVGIICALIIPLKIWLIIISIFLILSGIKIIFSKKIRR